MGTTLRPLDGDRRHRGDRNYGKAWSEVENDQDHYQDDYGDDYGDAYADGYEDVAWPRDRRWRPAIAVVGAVLAVGAVATAVIINSGDSASTKATVGAPAPRTSPSLSPSTSTTPAATRSPDASPSPSSPSSPAPLPVETFSRVTTPNAAQGVAPPVAAPPAPPLNPRTVFYSVNGSKQILDLVNVTYTDARGYTATDFNVSLPWSRVIVLNPEVQSVSVVASSFYARLNCSVVNAAGQTVVASNTNTNQATCTR